MKAVKLRLGKNKRELMLLSILIALFMVTIYFYIFFKPTLERLVLLLPKVSMLKMDLVNAKSLIQNKDIIEKENEMLQLKMKKYGKIFPGQREIPRILEDLSSIANESRVRIIGIKPSAEKKIGPEKGKKIYQGIPIEIIAKAGYHQLGRFLQKLETGKRFMMIKDLEISVDKKNIKRHNVNLTASTYTLIRE